MCFTGRKPGLADFTPKPSNGRPQRLRHCHSFPAAEFYPLSNLLDDPGSQRDSAGDPL